MMLNKSSYKLLLLWMVVFAVVILPVVDAEVSLGKVKLNDEVELLQQGDGYTTCNISSVRYPNKTLALDQVTMYKRTSTEFNYTFNKTIILGRYIVNGFCDNDPWAYSFDVTINGEDRINSGEGLTIIASLVMIMIVGIFLFALSFRFNSVLMKVILLTLSVIILIIIVMYSTILIQQTLSNYSNIITGYETFYFVMKIFASILLTVFVIVSLMVAVRIMKFKRGMID